MTMDNSRNRKSLEFLANQAVARAGEIARAIDREGMESNPVSRHARHLAVTGFDTMSKMVVLLLEKSKGPN